MIVAVDIDVSPFSSMWEARGLAYSQEGSSRGEEPIDCVFSSCDVLAMIPMPLCLRFQAIRMGMVQILLNLTGW